MLQVNEIRENKEKFIQALSKRGFDASIIFSDVLQTDELRKATQAKLDETLAQSNSFSGVKSKSTFFPKTSSEKIFPFIVMFLLASKVKVCFRL